MLSTNDAFDKQVKHVLNEVHSEEIPPEFLTDLQERLNVLEKKRRKKALFWFFISTIFAAMYFTGVFTLQSNSLESSNQKQLKNNPSTIKSPSSIQSNSTPTPTLPTTSKKANQKSVVERKFKDEGTIQSIPRIQSKSVQAKVIPTKSISSSRVPLKDVVENQLNHVDSPDLNQPVNTMNSDVRNTNRLSFFKESVPMEMKDGTTNQSSTEFIANSTTNATYLEPNVLPKEKYKWEQTFGIYMGMSGVSSSITMMSNIPSSLNSNGPTLENVKKYTEIRNAQERNISSIDMSFRTSWSKNHFVVQTGIDYFEWGEQLKYDYNIVFDGINRYSYVSVPCYLGYRQKWKKIALGASIGSSIGCVIKQNGLYLQQNLTTIAEEKAKLFAKTGYVQLEFGYQLDTYRFVIAPTYRRSLNAIISSDYTENTYQSFGLQIGLIYQIK
ncbi:MAG: hypothetical protein ACKOXP_10100 [Flavobacteriales bacterium]